MAHPELVEDWTERYRPSNSKELEGNDTCKSVSGYWLTS